MVKKQETDLDTQLEINRKCDNLQSWVKVSDSACYNIVTRKMF
jgi:hypothetical protein